MIKILIRSNLMDLQQRKNLRKSILTFPAGTTKLMATINRIHGISWKASMTHKAIYLQIVSYCHHTVQNRYKKASSYNDKNCLLRLHQLGFQQLVQQTDQLHCKSSLHMSAIPHWFDLHSLKYAPNCTYLIIYFLKKHQDSTADY